ncbi:MAG: Ig-like domain-containing protein [Fimbriimonadaceae bacterium]|nr:Ig-like domain-containing protein [Fimbriimonadaceae bacterium]
MSLVAAYGFNEGSGSTLTDLSGNGNTGAITNATWSSSGKYGKALSFNGTNSLVTINDSASLDLTNGMTIEAWVKPSTVSGWRSVVVKERPSNLAYSLYTSESTSRPSAYINTGGANQPAKGSRLSTSAWTHVAATYNGSSLRFYVNGELAETKSVSGNLVTSDSVLRIGGNSVWGQYYSGMIDEIRIYNHALSQSAIRTDMNTPVASTSITLTSVTPANGSTGVSSSTTVTGTFSVSVQPGSIGFVLKDSNNNTVNSTLTYDDSTRTATLTPNAALANSTTYTATINAATDANGNQLASPVSWSFTTAGQSTSTYDPTTLAPSLGTPPSAGPNVIWVSTVTELQNAVSNLTSGQTIVIRPGTYNLTSTLYIGVNSRISNVTIRGETDNFNDVKLLGKGMDNASYGNVPMGFAIFNAQNVTIANLSIGEVYSHPIQIKGESGANAINVYHVRLYDAGEQFVKVTPPASGVGTSDSSVKYSLIEYTNGTPRTDHGGGIGYTNGIDIHAGQNWLIKSNLIRNLHTPDSAANLWNPAILVWNRSSNVVTEGNTIINSDRAIAYGLLDRSSGYDNQNGVIRNNFIYQAPGLFSSSRAAGADGQILVWDSPGTAVDHNTILTNGNSPNSIQTRWTTTGAEFKNNLSDAPTRNRDGGSLTTGGNYLSATSSMFVNASIGDLHLVSNSATQANVIDRVSPLSIASTDWEGDARPQGTNADIGADEYRAADTTAPSVTNVTPSQNATNVPVTTSVSSTFSEAVQASTISLTLTNPSGATVSGTVSYDATNFRVTFSPSSSLAYATNYTVRISGAKDLAGNTMGTMSYSFTTAAQTDTTPPTVTSSTPTSGATGVSSTSTATVTFNEALQSGTVNTTNFTLTDSSGRAVSASVSYVDSTRTATLTASSPLAASTTYTASIRNVKDSAGNVMASPFTWSFTTASTTSYSLWNNSTTPATPTDSDTAAVELGVKFYSDVSGSITGLKFYKGTTNTGTHVASLWTSTGTRLATATFTSETASGWQQVNFATPVQITAGVTYVASYHTTVGRYASDQNYFRTQFNNGPLHVPVNGGVYAYGSAGNFPTQSWNASNYWVDIVLSSSTTDTTPPTVVAQNPGDHATGVPITTAIVATFGEAVQPSTINFSLTDAAGRTVAASMTYNDSTRTATLTPTNSLSFSTTYTATVSGAKDLAGNVMSGSATETFTTVASSPPVVTAVSPTSGSTSVSISATVLATFDQSVQSSSITTSNFTLTDASGRVIGATVAYNDGTRTATLSPNSPLSPSTRYSASISGVKNLSGTPMASPFTWTFSTSGTTSESDASLLYQSNMQYVGAFRVPNGTLGASRFSYGGSAIAYNPTNNSLFAVGRPADQAIAEISIPSSIVNSSRLSDLAVSSVIQPFSSILPRIPNNPANLNQGGYEAIGGLMVVDGQLIGTVFNTYDASGSVTLSHFKMSSLNLASSAVTGLYQVGTMGGGMVGGYMTPVPSEWQSSLGAPYLTGQAAISILGRTSAGPSAFGFDPANFGTGVTPATPYLYYDEAHQTLGAGDSSPPTLYNSTVVHNFNTGFGVFFVPGTRSIVYLSAIGTGEFYYGDAAAANDPNRTDKGPHSVGGNYVWQAWAYDVDDFIAVKNGEKSPWDVMPYSTWNFDFPIADGKKYLGGVAFDPNTGRLYVSQINVDNSRDAYDNAPLIQVFQITLPEGGGSTATLGAESALGTSEAVSKVDSSPLLPAKGAMVAAQEIITKDLIANESKNDLMISPGHAVTSTANSAFTKMSHMQSAQSSSATTSATTTNTIQRLSPFYESRIFKKQKRVKFIESSDA